VNRDDAILVLGAGGMVGSAIVRALESQRYTDIRTPAHAALDLLDQRAVSAYFESTRPAYVFMAAAKVGGILANDTQPADFLHQNLVMEAHVIDQAHRSGVTKLLFLGSTCIYPRLAPQPLREDTLLTGPLEPTNQWYAIAKIAGVKLCEAYRRQHGRDFISVMPTNLYGPHDNFDLATAHVLPALVRRFHEAQERRAAAVAIWGSGEPLREFLHVDDCAEACLLLMTRSDAPPRVNVGVGRDLPVVELARIVARVVGYDGEIAFDRSKPDGTPRKLVDTSVLDALGWRARIGLEDGIRSTYDWYRAHLA
jgi:GDP-L-fucose synthase